MADRFYRELPKPDERFAADHAPGAMVLSASRIPCLVLPPDQRPRHMPSPLAYALHLRGDVPLDGGGNSRTRRGKRLEPLGEGCAEDHGLIVLDRQVRHERADIPALTYLDLVTNRGPLELKAINENALASGWSPRPPMHVRIQAQAQAMIANVELVLIGAIVLDWYGEFRMEIYEEPAHAGMQKLLLDRCGAFMDTLRRGDLPPPDESASSYRAWSAIASFDNRASVRMVDPEAVERAARWRQARADFKAVEAIEEAQRLWFMSNAPHGAERLELLDGTIVRRTATNRRGFVVEPTRSITWKFEDHK